MNTQEIIQKIWTDEVFKSDFIANPKKYLGDGFQTLDVQVLEDTDKVRHLILPPLQDSSVSDEELKDAPVLRAALDPVKREELKKDPKKVLGELGITLASDCEVYVYEIKPDVVYFLIPRDPSQSELSSSELEAVAGGISGKKGCTLGAAATGAKCLAITAVFSFTGPGAAAPAGASGVVASGFLVASAVVDIFS